MAAKKKINKRCPLQAECEMKCLHEGVEHTCSYFRANLRMELEQEAVDNGILVPWLTAKEDIDWDSVPDDDSDDLDEDREIEELQDETEEKECDPVQTSGFDEDGEEPVGNCDDLLPSVTPDSVIENGFLGGERGYTAKIQDCINRAKHEFVFIGLLLHEVDAFGYFREGGFADVYEYCEVTFGFKRSSTNNFMRIYRKFGEAMGLQERYRKYSYSQLTEMCSMDNCMLRKCSPEMSVQQLREIKRPKSINFDVLDRAISSADSVQTSGQKYIEEVAGDLPKLPPWLNTKIHFLLDECSDKAVVALLDYAVSVFANVDTGYFDVNLIGNQWAKHSVLSKQLCEGKLYIAKQREVL